VLDLPPFRPLVRLKPAKSTAKQTKQKYNYRGNIKHLSGASHTLLVIDTCPLARIETLLYYRVPRNPIMKPDYSLYLVTDNTQAILGDRDILAVVRKAVEGGKCSNGPRGCLSLTFSKALRLFSFETRQARLQNSLQ
jgi:hypothetical protein